MIIKNLKKQIQNSGKHALFTGTFNPPHIGHSNAIKESFQLIPDLSSAIIIPDNWNYKKSPPVKMDIRVNWLRETVEEFLPELTTKIFILHNPAYIEQPDKFDHLCDKYFSKINRIVGSDKISILIGNKNKAEVLQTTRNKNITSTIIRAAIKTGSIDDIRAIIAQKVLADILKHGYFK